MDKLEALALARTKRTDKQQAEKTNPTQRWEKDKLSLRKAINAFCFQCVGEVVKDVRHCTATKCPLWLVRPYQDKTGK